MDRAKTSEISHLEELQRIISTASERVEAEFQRTANDWLSCFGSSVFLVETYLGMKKTQEMISPQKLEEAIGRLEKLKEKLRELKQRFLDKNIEVTDQIKKELFADLDVLK